MRLHAAMMTMSELPDLRDNVARLLAYADTVTVVDGGSTDGTIPYMRNWTKLVEHLHYYIHPWTDNFPAQRNNYLARVLDAGAEIGDWILAVDPDEILDIESLQAIRAGIAVWSAAGIGLVRIPCRAVSLMGEKRVHVNEDEHWKPLLFRIPATPLYYGHDGDQPVHEKLVGVVGHDVEAGKTYQQLRGLHIAPLWYEHRKQQDVVWWRGARNYFVGGGGLNLGSTNHRWVELRQITGRMGIAKWADMLVHLLAGNINEELAAWIIKYHEETGWDGSSEQREWYKLYYRMLHPEEEPAELRGKHIE